MSEKQETKEEKFTVGTMFWVLVIFAIGAITVLYFFSDTVYAWLMAIVDFLYTYTDPLSLGLVFFGIMIFQSIALPIPSEAVLPIGGALFAALYPGHLVTAIIIASLIGYTASIIGGIILFYIGRRGGRPLVIKLLGKSTMTFIDNWFKRWGGWAVGLGRLLPFIFYDPISVVSGATDMKVKHYLYGSLAGTGPRVVFLCGLGSLIPALTTDLFTIIMMIIIGVGLLLLFLYWITFRRYAKKEEAKKAEASAMGQETKGEKTS